MAFNPFLLCCRAVHNFIDRNRELILRESRFLKGFLSLLFKQRNVGEKWTKEEKGQLNIQVKHLAGYIPVLIIFAVPGGSLLLPLLAMVIDRRGKRREKS